MLYHLYLESGPQRKKTMVHVLELPGCVVTGPTTEEAMARTPDIIREYLRLLQHHGEVIDAEIQLEVAQHITEGSWLGNGDPALLLPGDLEPLTIERREECLQLSQWIRQEMLAMVQSLSDEQWQEKPARGRTIRAILEHVFNAEYSYIRGFGKLEGMAGPGSVERKSRDEFLAWMEYVRTRENEKIRALTESERSEQTQHGQQIKTASKVMRRMLEHEWEHLMEIKVRLGYPL
ncbi:hypothetical protein KDW_63310 [Dictyobacter vulcani]|uniref:DinB-like domain-containing protein n=1 Tax=Dictyobacter vulcani TaxID=2607529 RepID=A0A5J4L1J5_9CHLR|nr:type II toxin-antitoxin system HicB family antitoxin [Dictyobacter vulcani]GER92169.1 hypothetical protein KDW_63310 [Dictyobacter vulcani]